MRSAVFYLALALWILLLPVWIVAAVTVVLLWPVWVILATIVYMGGMGDPSRPIPNVRNFPWFDAYRQFLIDLKRWHASR
jgi:hypothetical protein